MSSPVRWKLSIRATVSPAIVALVPFGGALDCGGGGEEEGPPPPLALTFGENGSFPPNAISSGGVGRGDWPPCELGAGAGEAGVVPCVVGALNGEFSALLGFRMRK